MGGVVVFMGGIFILWAFRKIYGLLLEFVGDSVRFMAFPVKKSQPLFIKRG
ncbi:hypothetical protein [Halobacillus sp. A5]|uniref:hypothetical protein n=1 Tax=Halobacillus sp. A5 TaxID=2880263 RepID=UPI0020A67F66|nr:hypothetical protein [Halobacillus sp. A5]MCP3027576.1 hypothetical protein [Halobacillus sp. A5]